MITALGVRGGCRRGSGGRGGRHPVAASGRGRWGPATSTERRSGPPVGLPQPTSLARAARPRGCPRGRAYVWSGRLPTPRMRDGCWPGYPWTCQRGADGEAAPWMGSRPWPRSLGPSHGAALPIRGHSSRCCRVLLPGGTCLTFPWHGGEGDGRLSLARCRGASPCRPRVWMTLASSASIQRGAAGQGHEGHHGRRAAEALGRASGSGRRTRA